MAAIIQLPTGEKLTYDGEWSPASSQTARALNSMGQFFRDYAPDMVLAEAQAVARVYEGSVIYSDPLQSDEAAGLVY